MCNLCDNTIYTIFGFINVDNLCICDNVKILPNNLNGLKSLNISNNKNITFIPSNLESLEELYCNNTNITYINHEFTNLKIIEASNSLLFSIGPFNNLEYLNVENCKNFNHISNDLTNLKRLNINNTNILNLPDNLISLEILHCKNSNISSIPNTYINLIDLDCSNNSAIKFLPNTFLNLEILNCNDTSILKIPGTYLFLKKLYWASSLEYKYNIPDTLINLEELILYKNDSHKYFKDYFIPDSLTKLKILNCEHQNIDSIPNTLINLIEINCSNNKKLKEISNNLINLKKIICDNTQVIVNNKDLLLLQCNGSQINNLNSI